MKTNDYRKIKNFKINNSQIRVNKVATNYFKNVPIINREKNYIYNNNINKTTIREAKYPIRTVYQSSESHIITKPIIKSIYKSESSNQFKKNPEIKIKDNSSIIYNESDFSKNFKMSSSYIGIDNYYSPSNYLNNKQFIYNKTKFPFGNTNLNDIKNLKKNNGINSHFPMKIILMREDDFRKDNNYFYAKVPTTKTSPKSQRLSNTKINNKSNYVKRKIENKNLNNYNNYNFPLTHQKTASKEFEKYLNSEDNLIYNYNFKNNQNMIMSQRKALLEKTNLNKNNQTFNDIKFSKLFNKKDLYKNLAFFCDKIEDISLEIFKNYFIFFINNLKDYQKKDSNRTLLLKRLFETKTHIRRSPSGDGFDQKNFPTQHSYYKIKINNNNDQDKIGYFQHNIINNMINKNQNDSLNEYNSLINKPLNFEKKKSYSPIASNTFYDKRIGDMFIKTESNNIFLKNDSFFKKNISDRAKLRQNIRNYDGNLYKVSHNDQNIKNYYFNTEFFNTKNNSEGKNKENSNTYSKIYVLNTRNSKIYSKPVLKKSTSKNFETAQNELSNSIILKRSKMYDHKTYYNLGSKKFENSITRNKKELKEKIIKNVSTRDKRLHVFIKYVFFTFNRVNNMNLKSQELSLLKLLNVKNKNMDIDMNENINNNQNITSFNPKLYKIDNSISIEIIKNLNGNKNINKYLLNAVIFLTNLLQNIFEDKNKHSLKLFISNLKKIKNDKIKEKSNQTINVSGSKIIRFRKIIPARNYNDSLDNNENDRFKSVTQLRYSSDYKNRNESNNKKLLKSYFEINDNNYLSAQKRSSDINEYKSNTVELNKNMCFTEVQSPKIVTKIKIVNIINKETKDEGKVKKEDKNIDEIENKEKENEKEKDDKLESKLEKLKKLKLGKLFNNLDHDNKIINTIKNQFLDWNVKNSESKEKNKSDEKKHNVKAFENENYESKDKEVYDSMNKGNNNKDDDNGNKGKAEELKKNLENIIFKVKNKEK